MQIARYSSTGKDALCRKNIDGARIAGHMCGAWSDLGSGERGAIPLPAGAMGAGLDHPPALPETEGGPTEEVSLEALTGSSRVARVPSKRILPPPRSVLGG